MDRQVCTKENPKPFDSKYKWIHPDAVAPDNAEYRDIFTCPNCGHSFRKGYDD